MSTKKSQAFLNLMNINKTRKLINLEFQNSKIERYRVLKLENLKSSSLVNIH